MKPLDWTIAFVLGLFIHVSDVVLTIELLRFESNVIEFYEGNRLLAPLFVGESYLAVFLTKCLGWFIVMCLAIHHRIKQWVTPAVIWSTVIGFGAITAWNFGWLVYLTYH